METLLIAAVIITAISFGPLLLRLFFLVLCIAWDVITDTRAGVEFYDSIYGPPEGN